MQRFINPYHFIPLGEKPNRTLREQSESESGKKLTGSINYRLTTRSRLFIPNTSSDKAFSYKIDKNTALDPEHKQYDFFSYEILDLGKNYENEYFEPVIPGSEVRGMIRSIYEAVTNSCLSVLDGKTRIGKRTVEQFKPAVLKWRNGRIYLYDVAENKKNGDTIYRNREDFSEKRHLKMELKDGMKVSFTRTNPKRPFIKPDVLRISADPEEYRQQGYLLKGNQGEKGTPDMKPNRNSKCKNMGNSREQNQMLQNGKCPGNPKCPGKDGRGSEHCYLAEKHCAHVFFIKDEREYKDFIAMNDESLKTLEIVLDQYLKADPESYKEYAESYRSFISGESDGLPVYYSKLEKADYYMFSPARITREVYRNTVNDLAKEYQKCGKAEENRLCPACSLFGIVNTGIARGSRIRFSDLTPTEKALTQEENKKFYDEKLLVMDPLAVPHLENTEFYLRKPGTELSRRPEDPDGEVWFWTYDYYTVKKGNKVIVKSYRPEISGRKYYWNNLSRIGSCKTQDGLNRTVRTVRSGVEFTGTVYFDGITQKELNQLLFILTFTADGTHGYKLGTGKPLGLGSVELSIKDPADIRIRKFDETGYQCLKYQDNLTEIAGRTFQELGMDTRVEALFKRMTQYPKPEEMEEIHYPKTGRGEDEEGFKWFMENKKYLKKNDGEFRPTSSPNSREQTRILQPLPPLQKDRMPWLTAGQEESFSKRSVQSRFEKETRYRSQKTNI